MDRKAKIGISIMAVIGVGVALFLWHFLPIEACLDRGGVWDDQRSICSEP